MEKFPRVFLDTLWSLVSTTGRILTTPPTYLKPTFRLCDRNHRNGISNNPEDTCLISPGWDCEKCHDEKLYLEDHHHYCAEHHNSLLWSPNSGNQQFLSGTGTACAPRVSKDGEFVPVDGGKVVVDSRVHFEMITELQQMRILCSSLQSYLRTPVSSHFAFIFFNNNPLKIFSFQKLC